MKNYKFMIVSLFLLVIFIMGCAPTDIRKPKEMTKELCEDSGGHWNECSSPCLGTGEDVCVQMCVAQCECGGIAGFKCPEGYKCRLSGKIADELGACVK